MTLLHALVVAGGQASPDDLIGWAKAVGGLSGASLLAIAVVAFARGWVVRGAEYRTVVEQRDKLMATMLDEVIPLATRQTDLLAKIEPRIQPVAVQVRDTGP